MVRFLKQMQSDTSCRRLNVSTFTYWSLINLIDSPYYSCIDSINIRVRNIWFTFKVKIMFVDLTEDEQTTGSRHIRSGSGPLAMVESRVRELQGERVFRFLWTSWTC